MNKTWKKILEFVITVLAAAIGGFGGTTAEKG